MTKIHTTPDFTPRAWVGCLACYNAGELVGQWCEARNAHDITLEKVHSSAAGILSSCEELWCFDTENIPVAREMSPHEAAQWGEVFDEVDEHLWPAFHAWIQSGDYSTQHGSDLPAVNTFIDNYLGDYESFASYLRQHADDMGLLADAPEVLCRYFDWGSFARDEEHNYTVCETPGSVFVFLS
ncbi:MAG: antirestriction protein ArdA [Microbacteriaceae bacterium]